MPWRAVEENIRAVVARYKRNGLCVKVLLDGHPDLAGDHLVPHPKICLTTPTLLEEAGLEPKLGDTHDLDDPYQYTLWLPAGDPGTVVEQVRSAFRGPFLKGEVSRAWTTDDLRGLHRPGP